LALNDLYFMAKYILGFWWLCWDPHKEFADEIQKDKHLSLYLLPRGHCKTYIFNTADTIRQHLKDPTLPIAIFCDNSKRAKWKLRPIKQQFESNETLKRLWPDLCWSDPKRDTRKLGVRWSDEEIVLPGHPRVGQEPSIGCYGLDNMPTSLHFPRIKGDDLVTPEVVTTSDQIKKNIANFGLVRSSILSPGGNLQVCGTIYNDGDLHRTMEESGDYTTFKRPAEWVDEDGVWHSLWPVQYPREHLEALKRDPSVGLFIYSCQYLLDPAPDDENAYFQLKWFPRYQKRPRILRIYAAGDLAISEKETACHTAFPIAGLDTEGDLYLLEVAYGHWNSLTIVNKLIDLQARWKPEIFDLEAENIQRTIMPFLKLKMRETGIYLNIPGGGVMPAGDKVAKARPFQGRAREGGIWLPAKGPNQPEWLWDTEQQIIRFPHGKRKDIIDSLALLCQRLNDMWKPRTPEEIAREEQRAEFVTLEG